MTKLVMGEVPPTSQYTYLRSTALLAFLSESRSPPSFPPSCWPTGSLFDAPRIADVVSEEAGGGCPEIGPVFSPATEMINYFARLVQIWATD